MGKTQESYIDEGTEVFRRRIIHYLPFEIQTIGGLKKTKNLSAAEIKTLEGALILKHLKNQDTVILLDENGKTFHSTGFADFIQKQMNSGTRQVVFVVGGAWGFSQEVYQRSNHLLSLSKMTFSHQVIRLIFMEQFYRAMTILKNEPYHNS